MGHTHTFQPCGPLWKGQCLQTVWERSAPAAHPSRRPTRVGCCRLAQYRLPISGKPAIGGPPQDEVGGCCPAPTTLMVRSVAQATRLEPWPLARIPPNAIGRSCYHAQKSIGAGVYDRADGRPRPQIGGTEMRTYALKTALGALLAGGF